jgi:hypothetical protein
MTKSARPFGLAEPFLREPVESLNDLASTILMPGVKTANPKRKKKKYIRSKIYGISKSPIWFEPKGSLERRLDRFFKDKA